MTIDEAWAKYTTSRRICKYWKISCNKGNWSVEGVDLKVVTNEAMNYFRQYYEDGEYSEGGTSGDFMKRAKEAGTSGDFMKRAKEAGLY